MREAQKVADRLESYTLSVVNVEGMRYDDPHTEHLAVNSKMLPVLIVYETNLTGRYLALQYSTVLYCSQI